jgi:DNA-binding NarL/FixJ family response regulator
MERLLLVEHNLLFREGLALLLKWRTGLSSVYARSLAEAKGILEEANQKPACVIVDLDLPEGEGTEVLKELNGLPVLALIRSRNLERRGEAIGLGANQVLRATGPPEKIVAAVERLIGPRSITAF